MKKILLGTTAIVGAFALTQAAAAQTAPTSAPLTVYLGGQVDFHAGIIDEKNNQNLRGYTSEVDSSVLLAVKSNNADLFNYGARVQLLPSQNDTDATDEYVIYVEGQAGTVELGAADGAADRLAVLAPADFGTGGITGQYNQFINTTNAAGTTGFPDGQATIAGLGKSYKAFDSDGAVKITYFAPRVEGFQFGMSFAPDGSTTKNARSGVVGASGTTNGLLNRESFQNYVEMGVNYADQFDDVGVKASATYTSAASKDPSTAGGTDYKGLASVQLGAQASYEGFTFGGGYVDSGKSGYAKTAGLQNDEAVAYNVGLQYETGPFVIGTNALFARTEGNQTTAGARGDDKANVVSAGATYKVVPGMTAYVEGTNINYKGTVDGSTTAFNNDATVFIFGTSLAF